MIEQQNRTTVDPRQQFHIDRGPVPITVDVADTVCSEFGNREFGGVAITRHRIEPVPSKEVCGFGNYNFRIERPIWCGCPKPNRVQYGTATFAMADGNDEAIMPAS